MRNCFKLFYFLFYSLPFFPMTYSTELFKIPETTPLLQTPEEEHRSHQREHIAPCSCSAGCQAGCTHTARPIMGILFSVQTKRSSEEQRLQILEFWVVQTSQSRTTYGQKSQWKQEADFSCNICHIPQKRHTESISLQGTWRSMWPATGRCPHQHLGEWPDTAWEPGFWKTGTLKSPILANFPGAEMRIQDCAWDQLTAEQAGEVLDCEKPARGLSFTQLSLPGNCPDTVWQTRTVSMNLTQCLVSRTLPTATRLHASLLSEQLFERMHYLQCQVETDLRYPEDNLCMEQQPQTMTLLSRNPLHNQAP